LIPVQPVHSQPVFFPDKRLFQTKYWILGTDLRTKHFCANYSNIKQSFVSLYQWAAPNRSNKSEFWGVCLKASAKIKNKLCRHLTLGGKCTIKLCSVVKSIFEQYKIPWKKINFIRPGSESHHETFPFLELTGTFLIKTTFWLLFHWNRPVL